MKVKRNKWISAALWAISLLTVNACLGATPSPVDTGSVVGPRIQFDLTVLDFGKVAGGQNVNHDYTFTNTGDQMLEIQDVRPTCGCTIAGKWDSRIEPGKTGRIPISFTAPNIEGDIVKNIIVLCNDPSRTNVTLQIAGKIWKPIKVEPAYVMVGACEDATTNIARAVRISNQMEQPLSLSNLECTNRLFRASLTTIQNGSEYELQVMLVPPLKPGSSTASITLNTSCSNLPQISIVAFAAVQSLLTATPAEIRLPPGPLHQAMDSKVVIQNNGTAPVRFSALVVSETNVEVRLREIEPGRRFEITAAFPSGFQIQSGQHVEVQLKTDHPQLPLFKLPIFQNQHLSALLRKTTEAEAAKE